MKRILLTLSLVIITLMSSFAGEMLIKGTYQGENLYVKNPFASEGVGFCVYEVAVNGTTTTDEINSSAFEIDLSVFGFVFGDEVNVAIRYKEDCLPKVLNPDVLSAKATFTIQNLKIEGDKLVWTASNESGKLPYVVEQYRWNKWVRSSEIEGKGTPGNHTYVAAVRLHSGENRFRIRQTDAKNKSKISNEVTSASSVSAVTFSPDKVDDVITFSAPTLYEIYDDFGSIVFKGFGSLVKVSSLQKGKYYINYDNKLGRFSKK